MGKILAIKGHPTRGKEVIELLEMMGGINDREYSGTNTWKDEYYFLDNGYIRAYDWCDGIKFTLEEFLMKYPFKVGDKVERKIDWVSCFINDMRWDCDRMCVEYHLRSLYGNDSYGWHIAECFNKIEEHEANNMITKVETPVRDRDDILFDSIIWHLRNSVNNGKQYLSGGECETYFRELVKNVKENNMESCKCPEYEDIKVTYLSINDKEYADEIEVNLGDDYEYKFEMNRLYIVKKKPVYPKTYMECFYTLYGHTNDAFNLSGVTDEEYDLIGNFIKLTRCRNAYWKIAGEQMGLGKPWEPDWKKQNKKYIISVFEDTVIYFENDTSNHNTILAFPTDEMRDAFHENFKDLIEQCKELL